MRTPISNEHPVAYFCAEYGITNELPLYAGGLGILAGDTLKQADDEKFPLVGIGLLYRGYKTKQRVDETGLQIEYDDLYDPLSRGLEHVYIDDQPLFVRVHLTEVDVWLRVWKKVFPNGLTLYLLDSETDQNFMSERSITQELYSGSNQSQIKQQIVLGVGGIKVLDELGIQPSVYHLNEGRPAFLIWQLIRQLMDRHKLSYDSALEIAREKIVYTNHTLVAAGNKLYPWDQLMPLAKYYADKMRITVDYLLSLGRENDDFSITRFALNASTKANGVSALHTQLSQEQWPEYSWVSITNGVHLPTWQDRQLAQQFEAGSIWRRHTELKAELRDYVRNKTGFTYDPNALVITWARRFAGYKQANALFADIERLKLIVNDTDRPVQILISGKAHQGDTAGKEIIRSIIDSMKNELHGHALYIPDYSIEVAQHLVKGSDVWLNTPELGKEACGTSGMKAISNGVLQLSVADGWAAEVAWEGTGWKLNDTAVSESIYHLLESEIIPLYFNRVENIPLNWVEMMQHSMLLAQKYNTQTMLQGYRDQLYTV